MDGWKPLGATEQPATLVQRIRRRVVMYLLARLLRFVGWGAVFGLPGMVLGSRRVAGIARKYPIAVGTLCIGGLIGLTLWNESSHSQPARFEIESIDHFDDPTVMLAQTESPQVVPSTDQTSRATVDAAGAETEVPPWYAVDDADDIVTSGAGAANTSQPPIVWLTGHIEELSVGEGQSPVRNAVRFLPNRQ